MEKKTIKRNFSRAFDCSNCPGSNGLEGCPDWIEFLAKEDGPLGKDVLIEMCGRQAWPRFMTEVIAASNRPAAAIESMRNETVGAINNHALSMASTLTKLGEKVLEASKVKHKLIDAGGN